MNQTVITTGQGGRRGRYLGIDPGLNRTGYAIIECAGRAVRLVEGGVLSSRPSDSLQRRIQEISEGLQEVLTELKPDAAGVEQVFSHPRNVKTSLMLAHVRGAMLLTLANADVLVTHFTPSQIKSTLTGSGRAPKEQMQHAIRTELALDRVPEPNDVADASAVALCLYHSVRFAA